MNSSEYKQYEQPECQRRAVRGLPLIVRLDGKAFHTFTKTLAKPFDQRLVELMKATTRYLVEQERPQLAYTQSDEITLVWYICEDSASEYPYGGRYQKLTSIIAAKASAYFNAHLAEYINEKAGTLVVFDARAYQVPSVATAVGVVLWREYDGVKNSVSACAQAKFSHAALHGVNTKQKIEMLKSVGVYWHDLADDVKRGTYYVRASQLRQLTDDELQAIPQQHRPTGPVVRSSIERLSVPFNFDRCGSIFENIDSVLSLVVAIDPDVVNRVDDITIIDR